MKETGGHPIRSPYFVPRVPPKHIAVVCTHHSRSSATPRCFASPLGSLSWEWESIYSVGMVGGQGKDAVPCIFPLDVLTRADTKGRKVASTNFA
jgi:hypothetical protein